MSTDPRPVAPLTPHEPQPWRTDRFELAAYVVLAALLLFFFLKHLVVGLLFGLLFYKVLEAISSLMARRIPRRVARPLSLLATTLVVAGLITGAGALLMSMLKTQTTAIPALMTKMAEILESTRVWLGGIGDYVFPEAVRDAEDLKQLVVGWLKGNADTLKIAGGNFGRAIIHIIMGLLVATLVFFRHLNRAEHRPGPLAERMLEKVHAFANAFSQIVVAQVKISAVNTVLTGIYLLLILPLFGKELPFAKTIVLITFVCGLLPVVGNLISNTVIFIVSLGISPGTAIASLTFLIVIHKLEYVVNSRIVGSQISAQAWEILLAIIIGEAAFGVPGVVMAPIIYAFVKNELRSKALV